MLKLLIGAFVSVAHSSDVVEQKSCLTFNLGYEFILNNSERIFEQYLNRWNMDKPLRTKVQNVKTFKNTPIAGLEEVRVEKAGKAFLEKYSNRISVNLPIKATSKNG